MNLNHGLRQQILRAVPALKIPDDVLCAVKVISLLLNLIIFVVIFFIVMFIGIILSIGVGAPMKEPASLQFIILMNIALGLGIYFTRKLKVSVYI